MGRWIRRACVAGTWLGMMCVAGCGGSGKAIQIRYERPAREQVPAQIRSVAIAGFEGKTPLDRKWGEVASDKINALFDEYNRRFHRYRLVDRRALRKILDERNLQLAMSDPDNAPKVIQLAKVDALVCGNVVIAARDEHSTRMVIDPLTQRTKPAPHIRRNVNVNVTMNMVDTGAKTIIAVSATRNYDSDKQKGGGLGSAFGSMTGLGGNKMIATDQVINDLVTECVHELVGAVSPHEEVIKETLEIGKSKATKTGNTLAEAGDYKEALECYLAAIRDRTDDDGSLFNAGLMYEATGNVLKAEEFYDRAFKIEPKEKYVRARKRVRMAMHGARPN